ncbi:MAG: hypothetical protein GY861_13145 [bacterium]|nr:hypothetical protein [bacterium]
MDKVEMLGKYGDIPVQFTSWYKNQFTLKPVSDNSESILIEFSPDYRDNLGFQEVTTIRELTELDDHNHLYIFDGWEEGGGRREVYYGEGEA